jgi:hypothetical protein
MDDEDDDDDGSGSTPPPMMTPPMMTPPRPQQPRSAPLLLFPNGRNENGKEGRCGAWSEPMERDGSESITACRARRRRRQRIHAAADDDAADDDAATASATEVCPIIPPTFRIKSIALPSPVYASLRRGGRIRGTLRA